MGSDDTRTHHGASLQFADNHTFTFSFLYDRGLTLSGYSTRFFPNREGGRFEKRPYFLGVSLLYLSAPLREFSPIVMVDALKSVRTSWVSASYISLRLCATFPTLLESFPGAPVRGCDLEIWHIIFIFAAYCTRRAQERVSRVG